MRISRWLRLPFFGRNEMSRDASCNTHVYVVQYIRKCVVLRTRSNTRIQRTTCTQHGVYVNASCTHVQTHTRTTHHVYVAVFMCVSTCVQARTRVQNTERRYIGGIEIQKHPLNRIFLRCRGKKQEMYVDGKRGESAAGTFCCRAPVRVLRFSAFGVASTRIGRGNARRSSLGPKHRLLPAICIFVRFAVEAK